MSSIESKYEGELPDSCWERSKSLRTPVALLVFGLAVATFGALGFANLLPFSVPLFGRYITVILGGLIAIGATHHIFLEPDLE